MQVDEKALKYAYDAGRDYVMDMDDRTKQMIRVCVRAYLSALGEQKPVAWPRGTRIRVEHDGFEGVVLDPYITLEGKRGQVCQLAGARVVHVYGEKWLQHVDEAPPASPLPVRPITDEDVERAAKAIQATKINGQRVRFADAYAAMMALVISMSAREGSGSPDG